MNKKQLQKIIQEAIGEVLGTVEEASPFDTDESQVRPDEVAQVTDFLNSPENWQAAADFVSQRSGKEEDLVDFVKIHEPFTRWDWKKVKSAIDTADAQHAIGESKSKIKLLKTIKEAVASAVSEVDRGDIELQNSVNIDDLKKKIAKSGNAQLMDTFELVANKYKGAMKSPANLKVISRAVETASRENRWEDLEKWFMDQAIKTIKPNTQLQEFASVKAKKKA